ncbi:MAG: response regulator [Polyangiaceae bacterium]
MDDSEANLIALEAVLASLEIPIVAVRSGRAAIECVEKQMFAVAVLDVQMPEMDGFELTRRLAEPEVRS